MCRFRCPSFDEQVEPRKAVREANMARQQATLQNVKSIAAAALVGLRLVILFGLVDGPTAQLDCILDAAAMATIVLLPSSVPADALNFHSYIFFFQCFFPFHTILG